MKRKYPGLIAALLSFSIGIGIVWIIRSAESTKESTLISPVNIDYSCDEPKTSNSFEEFWPRFRAAVESDDREELFSLMHTCGFIWDDGRGTDLPLRSEEQIRAALKLQFPPLRAINSPLVFETQDDFLSSYHLIFPASIRNRILAVKPKEVSNGVYEIGWRQNGLHSLSIRRFEGIGYKFAGLWWEP